MVATIPFILYELCQAEKLGAEREMSALGRVLVDGEPHLAVFREEIRDTAQLRELLPIADREHREPLDRFEQANRFFRVQSGDVHHVTRRQRANLAPCDDDWMAVDRMTAYGFLQRVGDRAVARHAEDERGAQRDDFGRPLRKFGEVDEKGRFQLRGRDALGRRLAGVAAQRDRRQHRARERGAAAATVRGMRNHVQYRQTSWKLALRGMKVDWNPPPTPLNSACARSVRFWPMATADRRSVILISRRASARRYAGTASSRSLPTWNNPASISTRRPSQTLEWSCHW